jgi:hypothetical protein
MRNASLRGCDFAAGRQSSWRSGYHTFRDGIQLGPWLKQSTSTLAVCYLWPAAARDSGGRRISVPREKSEEIKGQTSLVESEKAVVQDDVSSSDQAKRQLEDAFHGIDKDNAENHLKRIEILKPEVERLQIKEDKDNTELYKGQAELQRLEAEGIFRHVMKNDWGNVAGGLLLLSAGLGLMVGVKSVRKDQPETPR